MYMYVTHEYMNMYMYTSGQDRSPVGYVKKWPLDRDTYMHEIHLHVRMCIYHVHVNQHIPLASVGLHIELTCTLSPSFFGGQYNRRMIPATIICNVVNIDLH